MSGLGRKVWNPLDLLAAADLNGYLMDQSIMVFADATARAASIPTPTEGMHTYRANDNIVEIYNGTAWVSANTLGGTIAASQLTGTISASQISGSIDAAAISGSLTNATINNTNVVNTLQTVAGTAYSVLTADQGKTLYFTSGTAVTATVGTATALTAGQRIDFVQEGAGTVTIAAGSGVSFAGRGTAASSYRTSRYDGATLLCVGSNTYRVIGNVTAV